MAAFAKAHFEKAEEAAHILQEDGTSPAAADEPVAKDAKKALVTHIPGKPVSGRVWKLEPKKVGKAFHSSWDQKVAERNRKRGIQEREKALKDEDEKAKVAEQKRREQRKKQKLENEKKGEVVQVIRNTSKIKRMSKKQLLTLRKR